MASLGEWVEAARVRTLPAAAAPVIAGTALALHYGQMRAGIALLCLLVALALQIGVNLANDYSDGIRGTDSAERVGPRRLVGSGAASPKQVKLAAFAWFAVAALAGVTIVALSGDWWLIGVGVASILAAWYYTGGKHPYGYAGWGEVFVFIFFGLVATVGTTYVQSHRADLPVWIVACGIGFLACAILVCNNLRDLDTDRVSGKLTLETRLGDQGSRLFFLILTIAAILTVPLAAMATTWWVFTALLCAPALVLASKDMLTKVNGFALVRTLKLTSLGELGYGVGLLAGVVIAALTGSGVG